MPDGPGPIALETLTHASFAPHVGETFRMRLDDGHALDLVLVAVTGYQGRAAVAKRDPFALAFRGPRAPVQPQRIYALEHAHMGTLEIFLVPTGPDEDGMRYEAVFT